MGFSKYVWQKLGVPVPDDFSESVNEMDVTSIPNLFIQKFKTFFNINETSPKKRRLNDTNSENTTLRKCRRLDCELPCSIQPFENNGPRPRVQRPPLHSRRSTMNSYAQFEFSGDEDDDFFEKPPLLNINEPPSPKLDPLPSSRQMVGETFGNRLGAVGPISHRYHHNRLANGMAPPLRQAANSIINPPNSLIDRKTDAELMRVGPPSKHLPRCGQNSVASMSINLSPSHRITSPVISLDDEEPDVLEVIDLDAHKNKLNPGDESFEVITASVISVDDEEPDVFEIVDLEARKNNLNLDDGLPYVEPVNTLKNRFDLAQICKPGADLLRVAQEKPMGIDRVPVNLSHSERRRTPSINESIPVISLDDEEPEIIDLDDSDTRIRAAYNKLNPDDERFQLETSNKDELPFVEPVNTLKDHSDSPKVCKPDWISNVFSKWFNQHESTRRDIVEAEEEVTKKNETPNAEKIKSVTLDPELVVIDGTPAPPVEDTEFPELCKDDELAIDAAIYTGPDDKVLITKFNMNITRRDVNSLVDDKWLNDEVINFYMNLLTERSEQRQAEGLPRVYAMNTFFLPRLLQSGHAEVRRWTRKVDIFSYEILPVPVHVGGKHWCMAIINMKEQTIKYYDSLGNPNPKVLSALQKYLMDESLDKKKQPFDTSNFGLESVADCPRQENGSDCGVFSCMFAEYTSRNRPITFSKQHMPYFRRKMILEIITGKLLL